MITVTGKIEDATGATLHANIDFISKSTPLAGSGIVTVNTDAHIRSNPSDGTFSVLLAPGNYSVTITANNQSTTFNIAVPTGTATMTIDTLVTTPLVYPFVAPNVVWNGQWAGNITFLPLAPPPAPTWSVVSYTGGGISNSGNEHYSYWVSYVTASGETVVGPPLQMHEAGGAAPNQANRIALVPNVSGVTSVHIWRSVVGVVLDYNLAWFPRNVALLATVSPSVSYYDDWETSGQLAARWATTIVAPVFNTTAGELLSSNGTAAAFITDQGLFFPGANCRIKAGYGLQVYNFTTQLWYTLLNTGNPPQWGFDAGNPN